MVHACESNPPEGVLSAVGVTWLWEDSEGCVEGSGGRHSTPIVCQQALLDTSDLSQALCLPAD